MNDGEEQAEARPRHSPSSARLPGARNRPAALRAQEDRRLAGAARGCSCRESAGLGLPQTPVLLKPWPRPAVTDPRHQTHASSSSVCHGDWSAGEGPLHTPLLVGQKPKLEGQGRGFLPAGAPRHACWDPPKEWLSSRPLPPRLYLPVFRGVKHGLALWVDLCPPNRRC